MNNTAFTTWLHTFLDEKNIDLEERFEVENNNFSYGVIVEHMEITSKEEQAKIKDVMVQIDFRNGDVKHFMRHLAKALVINL